MHICFPTSQSSRLCWKVSEHTPACLWDGGWYTAGLCSDSLPICSGGFPDVWKPLAVPHTCHLAVPKYEHLKPTTPPGVNSQCINECCSIAATWVLRHRAEKRRQSLAWSKTLFLCPSLPVKLSVDCSVQSLKEQLSLITSRLVVEVLSGSRSKAYVQIGHLHLSGRFNTSR